MRLMELLKTPDIDMGMLEYSKTPDAVLLDVRSPQEYRAERIPGSRNVPLHCMEQVEEIAQNRDVPIFVYCHSGTRSRQAAGMLEFMGYRRVKNIGGIASYTGYVER